MRTEKGRKNPSSMVIKTHNFLCHTFYIEWLIRLIYGPPLSWIVPPSAYSPLHVVWKKFLLAAESSDLSQADKILIRMSFFPKSDG